MAYYIKTRGQYNPAKPEEFRLSRSKIDLYLECPRCFYMDRKLGVSRPDTPPFTLNSAVDHLLKKEFDIHRKAGTAHPLMKTYKVDAIPFDHEELDIWRENFKGLQYFYEPTQITVTGAIDDLWISPKGELSVVDYKATSKDKEIELEDTRWHNQYRRQMEVYQWLLRKKGFNVSDTGYFVYVNGKRDRKAFDGKLEFDVKILEYKGNDGWVEKAILDAKKCLDGELPKPADECEYCAYRIAAAKVGAEHIKNTKKAGSSSKKSNSLF